MILNTAPDNENNKGNNIDVLQVTISANNRANSPSELANINTSTPSTTFPTRTPSPPLSRNCGSCRQPATSPPGPKLSERQETSPHTPKNYHSNFAP